MNIRLMGSPDLVRPGRPRSKTISESKGESTRQEAAALISAGTWT